MANCWQTFIELPTNQATMEALATVAEKEGAIFYYGTPCVQLEADELGAVTGAIGKNDDGYVKVNASKAVILATGDYQNNDSLIARYCPDVAEVGFDRRQANRTGDGHLLGSLAGGHIVGASHPRQIHDLAALKWEMLGCPLLMLDANGERFFNEECTMTEWNTKIKYHYLPTEKPVMFRFWDADFEQNMALRVFLWVAAEYGAGE